ncbi:Ribosome biogenesis protein brx1 [Balamuthia mandrillaris]
MGKRQRQQKRKQQHALLKEAEETKRKEAEKEEEEEEEEETNGKEEKEENEEEEEEDQQNGVDPEDSEEEEGEEQDEGEDEEEEEEGGEEEEEEEEEEEHKEDAEAKADTNKSKKAKAKSKKSKEPQRTLEPFKNKQKVLVLSSRGVTSRERHLMNDVRRLLAHSKKEAKLEAKNDYAMVREVADLNNCNNVIFFEARKRQELFMWLAKTPNGPSAKFLVLNSSVLRLSLSLSSLSSASLLLLCFSFSLLLLCCFSPLLLVSFSCLLLFQWFGNYLKTTDKHTIVHTMDELKLTGNCLWGSRPLLSFNKAFDSAPHWMLLREMLTQGFGTPRGHPKAKPFFDHVFTFSLQDNKIWFRNYQIIHKPNKTEQPALVEIGPRFVLDLYRIFEGCFGGPTLYLNPFYTAPSLQRMQAAKQDHSSYADRLRQRAQRKQYRAENFALPPDELADVFTS